MPIVATTRGKRQISSVIINSFRILLEQGGRCRNEFFKSYIKNEALVFDVQCAHQVRTAVTVDLDALWHAAKRLIVSTFFSDMKSTQGVACRTDQYGPG